MAMKTNNRSASTVTKLGKYGVNLSSSAKASVEDSFVVAATRKRRNFATTVTSAVNVLHLSPVPIVVYNAVVPKRMMTVESVSVRFAKKALVTSVSPVRSAVIAALLLHQVGTPTIKLSKMTSRPSATRARGDSPVGKAREEMHQHCHVGADCCCSCDFIHWWVETGCEVQWI